MSSMMPDSLAQGRYQLGQAIGHGGMAEVYMALDTRLGRTVAVKVMRADFANDQIFLSRFRREAHAVAQMNNPNIVSIYDSGEEDIPNANGGMERVPYLVMEYVKGQTLRDIIKANGALSQRDAEQVMLGVLSALDYSHRMGVIHRDIKPGNIMISEQGVVKVMDFGIARALDDSAATMTKSQGVVGTAQYLSPEQARGETVDMRSDLYSAGCVLYEMLTGRPPFTGDSAVAIAYQHVSEVATPPSAVVPGLPKMWDSICAKAMAKDRQNRYATAADFKNDLLTFMNGGVPVAAAFNPLTDLTNMKARRQAEQDAATVALNPTAEGQSTQAFNPVTGQFEQVVPQAGTGKTRAEQRAEAAKAKRKRALTIGGVVAAVAAVIVAFCVWWFALRTPPVEMVTVPELSSSLNQTGICQAIEEAGLVCKTETDTESNEREGTFTYSDPKSGASVPKGSTVTAYFSDGPDSLTVPDVSNHTQDEARSMLEKAGFEVNTSTRTEDSPRVERDRVTRTEPAAGETADSGSSITLWISSGMTEVPNDLVGQTEDAVRSTLTGTYAFNITIEHEYSDTVPAGSVTRVSPGSGSPVDQRANISVWVSLGKEQVAVPTFALGTDTLGTVRQQLEALGLTVSVTDPEADDSAIVTEVSSMGQQVDKGSTITVTTKAAEDETTTPDDEADGTEGNGNGHGGPES
ncbi:MAG TPA: Stk1 family PASTA domain-containing Ser/Thr kinase [Bifidobacterium pullorum]|nr:Stk1 family PASTA domain-containing Ser/Thr kinase [Bifidobacterium pullorum]